MIEPNGRQPGPSREGSFVWLLIVACTTAVLLSIAFPLAQGIKASAQIIQPRATSD